MVNFTKKNLKHLEVNKHYIEECSFQIALILKEREQTNKQTKEKKKKPLEKV